MQDRPEPEWSDRLSWEGSDADIDYVHAGTGDGP
jgi:hypothetical protein